MLTLPLQLLADYTVSDDFEDSLIDSKWKVEIINGAGAVTEHRTGQGEGVLELRLFFPDSIYDSAWVRVVQIMPDIVRENFHQNKGDYLSLGLWGVPHWYETLTETHKSRARSSYEVNFSNNDKLKVVFYVIQNSGYEYPSLHIYTYFNGTLLNSFSVTITLNMFGPITLAHDSLNQYTVRYDSSWELATFNSNGKVDNISFDIKGDGIYNSRGFATPGFQLNYDLDDYFFNNLTFGDLKYEELNNITINLKRYNNTTIPFKNAEVKLIDHLGNLLAGPMRVDTLGLATLSVIPDDTFPHRLIIANLIAKGQIDTFEIGVDYKVVDNVRKPSEVPVLKDNVIYIEASREDEPKELTGISGLTVILTDSQPGGFNYQGITDEFGYVYIPAYLKSNRPLYLTIDGVGYVPYTSTIGVYLWSNVAEAFGTNNQEHIVRKPNTDEMDMFYTTGDNVVYGRSIDFGKSWDLEILGRGTDPVLTRTASGLIAVWRDGTSYYDYSIKSSPWIPVDTLINPAILLSEPVMGYNFTTGKTYLGYINHNYLQTEAGDYILASMNELNTDDIYYDTVISHLGEYNKVPMKSPVFSLYSQQNGQISHLIGFIDTLNEYIIKDHDSLSPFGWVSPRLISNPNQICNAPTTDYYGEVTTFAWEVINIDGTRDIWEAKMTDGILGTPARVNDFIGVNRNPKVKNNYLTGYVNNNNKLISEPGYGLTYQENIVASSTEDSIFSYDVNLKETYILKKGLFVWTEGRNGSYKLKMKQVFYKSDLVPYIISELEDTIEKVITSPLYEYIGKREPVEQLNTTISGLNPEMNYTIKVITSEGSPVKPQIIQIDGEVYAVVTGHANRPDTTEITLPQETYEDYSVVVSIDRKRGNPNRDAKVLVYQYETDGEEVVVVSNKIQMVGPINMERQTTNLFTLKDNAYISYISKRAGEVEIEVYNIMGRKITSMKARVKAGFNNIKLSGLMKSGVYFIQISNEEAVQTKKINIIK